MKFKDFQAPVLFSSPFKDVWELWNMKKTEVLLSVANQDLSALSFSVHGDVLSKVQEFTYLGSILSDSCSLDSEVEHR